MRTGRKRAGNYSSAEIKFRRDGGQRKSYLPPQTLASCHNRILGNLQLLKLEILEMIIAVMKVQESAAAQETTFQLQFFYLRGSFTKYGALAVRCLEDSRGATPPGKTRRSDVSKKKAKRPSPRKNCRTCSPKNI